MFDPTEPTRKDRRVKSIALERLRSDVAAERKWAALEQFDDTPVVSATLRVRFRGELIAHSGAQLACTRSGESSLVCTNPACVGGEIRITGEGQDSISVSIGGTLKSGRFVGHYIHLDESCEGRRGGPLVLESGDDNRRFSMAAGAERGLPMSAPVAALVIAAALMLPAASAWGAIRAAVSTGDGGLLCRRRDPACGGRCVQGQASRRRDRRAPRARLSAARA